MIANNNTPNSQGSECQKCLLHTVQVGEPISIGNYFSSFNPPILGDKVFKREFIRENK